MTDQLLLTGATDATSITLHTLLTAIIVSVVIGLLVSFVYLQTHRNRQPSQSFVLTLVILPAVITLIIMLVGNNIARAFSLAGAFSIIRFRSAPGDAKDITYVLLTMAVGLATGMGFYLFAVIAAVLLCAVIGVLELAGFGTPRSTAKTLKITVPEDLNYQHAFADVLGRYTLSSKLRRVKTTELGSLFELNYAVVTDDKLDEKEFLDALRARNGNLGITLVMDAMKEGDL
ncbi:MAG: DUF4956 domain-containing protein [Lachnospiraceae bacterium]|jgi:type III secretory pathway component EscS|nr:DUF4956 domain-containing protein [Lachnospiraceae bacterium]